MTETGYLHLQKPGQGDYYNVDDFNRNADIIDAKLGEIDTSKAQPNGIATLNGSGKLAQMPTAADVGAVPVSRTVNGKALSSNISLSAADVGAIKLNWSTLINEESEIPNKYSFAVYITPGDVVSVCNYAGARSVTDIPEQVPGKLYVLPLRTDDQGRNDLMQEYHAATGNIWVRYRYYYSGNTWSAWNTAIHCSDPSDGNMCINFGGGMHICAGSQTWTNISIGNATQGVYASQTLFFDNFKRAFAYAPKCLIGMSVGAGGPYWLTLSSDGPTTARPQGFKLMSTTQFTVSTITMSYIAIGIS